MSKDTLKAAACVVFAVAMLLGIPLIDLSCKRAALERVTGHPVSLWDAFVLAGK